MRFNLCYDNDIVQVKWKYMSVKKKKNIIVPILIIKHDQQKFPNCPLMFSSLSLSLCFLLLNPRLRQNYCIWSFEPTSIFESFAPIPNFLELEKNKMRERRKIPWKKTTIIDISFTIDKASNFILIMTRLRWRWRPIYPNPNL